MKVTAAKHGCFRIVKMLKTETRSSQRKSIEAMFIESYLQGKNIFKKYKTKRFRHQVIIKINNRLTHNYLVSGIFFRCK